MWSVGLKLAYGRGSQVFSFMPLALAQHIIYVYIRARKHHNSVHAWGRVGRAVQMVKHTQICRRNNFEIFVGGGGAGEGAWVF